MTFQQILESRDEFGRLFDGQFHDGAFLGLSVDPSRCMATLVFADVMGRSLDLEFSGVIMLNATDFYQGNIVGDIWAWEVCKIPGEYWELLFRNRVHAAQMSEERRRIELAHPGVFGLAVSAAYGCEAVVLFESVVGRSRSTNAAEIIPPQTQI